MAKTLKSLSPGATLVVPGSNHNGVPPILRKLADDHHAAGTTLLDTRDIIDIFGFDGQEPENSDSDRANKGNNNYRVSNIRQYLNSVGPDWYEPQHYRDEPPSTFYMYAGYGAYEQRDGFLSAFPKEFVDRIVTTPIKTLMPDSDVGGITTLNDKIFLLSLAEMGLMEGDGTAIPFFWNSDLLLKKPTQQAINNSRITDKDLDTSKPWALFSRTPNRETTESIFYLNFYFSSYNNKYSINVYSSEAWYSRGIAPAMNLPSSMLVSDAPNAQGHYEIIPTPPIGTPKIKIGAENKEILEMYLNVNGSNKAVIETNISINGTIKPWV